MISSIFLNNSYIFSDEVELSLNADMRQKKFNSNVHKLGNYNVLKSLSIYGPNNVGKSCLFKSIRSIRDIILNKNQKTTSNIFTKNHITTLGVTFIESGKKYSYIIKHNDKKKEFIYEELLKIEKDAHGNEKHNILLLRDLTEKKYIFADETIQKLMQLTSKNNILIHLIDESKSIHLKRIKKILTNFAQKIDIINMNNIPIQQTIDILKSKDNIAKKMIKFIKQADLDMEDFRYAEQSEIASQIKKIYQTEADEEVLNIPERIMDQIKLTSVYKGVAVPSLFFDSTGTKKIISLSSYIIQALEKGRILIIDELDNSIHFKLARAIVSMFNNELNTRAQLIFSAHDINLMDCKKLFRKEQIWFIHKDTSGVYIYPLSDFTAADSGIRTETDIVEKYKKGILGAIPDPSFIETLLEVQP